MKCIHKFILLTLGQEFRIHNIKSLKNTSIPKYNNKYKSKKIMGDILNNNDGGNT